MFTEISDTLSSNLTIISSIIAISSVTICTIFSSIFTQLGMRKNKHAELIFREKIVAYYDFLSACDQLYKGINGESMLQLSNTSTKAMLFASRKTQILIVDYAALMMQSQESEKISTLDAAKLREQLIYAMQKDLKK